MPPRKAKRANQAKATQSPSPLLVKWKTQQEIEEEDFREIEYIMSKDGSIVKFEATDDGTSYFLYPDNFQAQQKYSQEETCNIRGISYTRSGKLPRYVSREADNSCHVLKDMARKFEAPLQAAESENEVESEAESASEEKSIDGSASEVESKAESASEEESEVESDTNEPDQGDRNPARWKEFLKDNTEKPLPSSRKQKRTPTKQAETKSTDLSSAVVLSRSQTGENNKQGSVQQPSYRSDIMQKDQLFMFIRHQTKNPPLRIEQIEDIDEYIGCGNPIIKSWINFDSTVHQIMPKKMFVCQMEAGTPQKPRTVHILNQEMWRSNLNRDVFLESIPRNKYRLRENKEIGKQPAKENLETAINALDAGPASSGTEKTGKTSPSESRSSITPKRDEQIVHELPANQHQSKDAQKQRKPFQPRRHPAKQRFSYITAPGPVTCLLFKPTDGTSLHLTNKTDLAKALSRLSPQPVEIRRIRNGGLAVDFPANQDLTQVSSVQTLGEIPIQVSAPKPSLSLAGVIKGEFSSAAEVMDLYVIHADNPPLNKITQLGKQPVFRLDFTSTRPDSVKLFYHTHPVTPYYISPLRCYQCSAYGHKAVSCKRTPTCSICASSEHSHHQCPKTHKKCANCGGHHAAVSNKCPHRSYLLTVAKTAAARNITLAEARTSAQASYADKLKANLSQSTRPKTQVPPPVHQSDRDTPSKGPITLNADALPKDMMPQLTALLRLFFPGIIISQTSTGLCLEMKQASDN